MLTETTTMDLVHGSRLEIDQQPNGDQRLRLSSQAGVCTLTIELTATGPRVVVHGAELALEATRVLSLRAPELIVQAETARFDIAGDLTERVAGRATRLVRGEQRITASELALESIEGSLTLKANDDVTVRGERVRLNSDDPPMPISLDEFRQRRLR